MVKHNVEVINGSVYVNGVHIHTPLYHEMNAKHGEKMAEKIKMALEKGPKSKGWVVKNPAGQFLQDEGSNSIHAPGFFGNRRTAHIFATKKRANSALFGLLGPGRGAKAEKA